MFFPLLVKRNNLCLEFRQMERLSGTVVVIISHWLYTLFCFPQFSATLVQVRVDCKFASLLSLSTVRCKSRCICQLFPPELCVQEHEYVRTDLHTSWRAEGTLVKGAWCRWVQFKLFTAQSSPSCVKNGPSPHAPLANIKVGCYDPSEQGTSQMSMVLCPESWIGGCLLCEGQSDIVAKVCLACWDKLSPALVGEVEERATCGALTRKEYLLHNSWAVGHLVAMIEFVGPCRNL